MIKDHLLGPRGPHSRRHTSIKEHWAPQQKQTWKLPRRSPEADAASGQRHSLDELWLILPNKGWMSGINVPCNYVRLNGASSVRRCECWEGVCVRDVPVGNVPWQDLKRWFWGFQHILSMVKLTRAGIREMNLFSRGNDVVTWNKLEGWNMNWSSF